MPTPLKFDRTCDFDITTYVRKKRVARGAIVYRLKSKQNVRLPVMYAVNKLSKKVWRPPHVHTKQKLTNFVKFARVLWKAVFISRGLAPIWSLWHIIIGRRMWELPRYSRWRSSLFLFLRIKLQSLADSLATSPLDFCVYFAARFLCFLNWFWGTEKDCLSWFEKSEF